MGALALDGGYVHFEGTLGGWEPQVTDSLCLALLLCLINYVQS